MGLNPNGPMPLARAVQLRDQCAADLAEARWQMDVRWVDTLDKRLKSLDELVKVKRRKFLAADRGDAG